MKNVLTDKMREELRVDVRVHGNPVPALEAIRAKHGEALYRLACDEALRLLHQKLGIPVTTPTHFGIHAEAFDYSHITCVTYPMPPLRLGQSTLAAVGSMAIHPCE